MKLASVLFGLAVTALLPGALLAQNTVDAPAAPAKPVKEKKICRRQEVTGSTMGTSTCHTAAQWAAIDGQNSENAETLRQRSAQTR